MDVEQSAGRGGLRTVGPVRLECSGGEARVEAPQSLCGKTVYLVEAGGLRELERRVQLLDALRLFLSRLLGSREGRRMFSMVTETWNPVTGCLHNCVYCWARRLALTRLRNTRRYRDGFRPRLNPEEFRRGFRGGIVFVSDMGDLFGDWVPAEWIRRVLGHIRRYPDTLFLLLTKNPARYHEFLAEMPRNVILGATIETNRDDIARRVSQAPPPSQRYEAMRRLEWPLKFISIEPILDFDLDVFASWVREINPFMVYIGYDNYGYRLPEPPLGKTLRLIEVLERHTVVVRKTLRPAWYERGSLPVPFNSGFKSDKGAERYTSAAREDAGLTHRELTAETQG